MPTTDYSQTIRAEIEAAVSDLIQRLSVWNPGNGWEPVCDVIPEYVELGYMVNTHHGYDLYKESDVICGLPVKIVRILPRTISVYGGEVRCERDVEYENEDGELEYETEYETESERFDAEVSITW